MTRASQVTKRCCMTSMGEPMNEYEAKRAQRMAANRAALLALQIDSLGPKRPARAPARRPVIPGAPLRRSSRLNIKRSAEPEAGHNQLVMLADRRKKESKRIRLAKDVTLALPLADAGRAPAARSRVPSSQLSTDLEWFHTRWLGHQLQPRGKRPVMQGMSPEGFVPTFSQMSGLQQWKNALVLFVNVDGSAGYANTFHETAVAGDRTAVSFRWFAQRRWTTESPAVRRLCNTKRGHRRLQFDATFDAPLDPTASQDDPLLLFLRNEQGPYVYCGRLGFLGYLPGSQPLEFRWQLLDIDALDWTWTQVRQLIATGDALKNETIDKEQHVTPLPVAQLE